MCPACIASLALWVGGGATASGGLAALLLARRKRPDRRAIPATASTENRTTKERP